jgi:hypothetical protein
LFKPRRIFPFFSQVFDHHTTLPISSVLQLRRTRRTRRGVFTRRRRTGRIRGVFFSGRFEGTWVAEGFFIRASVKKRKEHNY